MRKLLVLALLASVTGCQAFGGLFKGTSRTTRDAAPVASCPDPLMSPDIEEQQRLTRSRYAYPDPSPTAGPPVIQDRPSPSGR